jgi:hypothetical protein
MRFGLLYKKNYDADDDVDDDDDDDNITFI